MKHSNSTSKSFVKRGEEELPQEQELETKCGAYYANESGRNTLKYQKREEPLTFHPFTEVLILERHMSSITNVIEQADQQLKRGITVRHVIKYDEFTKRWTILQHGQTCLVDTSIILSHTQCSAISMVIWKTLRRI
jgi:hypothetical protein